jgi:hypothetical protein
MSNRVEPNGGAKEPSTAEREVLEAIRGIRYGTVQVTIHDGQVVQIERSEKLRLTRGS